MTAAAVSLFVVVPLTFMALDRNNPVKIISQTLEGDMRPSKTVTVVWEAVSTRSCTGTARQWLVAMNGIVYDYAQRPTVIRGTGVVKGRYAIQFDLPYNIPPGLTKREVQIQYYCNWLQWVLNWPIVIDREPIWFEILPRTENPK